jgi:glycosyltransferase involved in cell wall biosynthesis
MTPEPQTNRPVVAITGIFKFPAEDASGRRVLALAKLLESSGVQVVIGSANPTPDRQPSACEDCEFPTFHLSELPQRSTPRLLRAMREFVWGGRAISWLESLNPKPAMVILYGGYSPFSLWLLRFRHKTGIPIAADAVEWYQPDHVPGGRFGPFRLNIELALRRLFPDFKNIICISRYLQHHFEIKGCRTLYLPAVLDVTTITSNLEARPDGNQLRLVYTGTPGKKDLLNPVVEALLRLTPDGAKAKFTIVGPSTHTILTLPALKERGIVELPGCLEVPGYMSNAQATTYVSEADFSILLRNRERYAMAGFPTKVPESLAAGTPVICNYTSDLKEYIIDGREGIICSDPTVESFMIALERALTMRQDQRAEMRRNARRLAENSFDYRNYINATRSYLSDIKRIEN